MAFAGMFLIFLIITAIILGGLFIGGLFLVIFMLLRIRKHRKNGETVLKGEIIGIIVGSLMIAVPVLAGAALIISVLSTKAIQ